MNGMSLLRRLLAVLLALGLAALGLVMAAESVSQLLDIDPPLWVPYYSLSDWASQPRWNDPYVLGGSALLALVGLGLLVVACWPGPRTIRLDTADRQVKLEMPLRALRRLITYRVGSAEGLSEIEVRTRPRRVMVRAATPSEHPELAENEMTTRVNEGLDALSPHRRPRIVTRPRARPQRKET